MLSKPRGRVWIAGLLRRCKSGKFPSFLLIYSFSLSCWLLALRFVLRSLWTKMVGHHSITELDAVHLIRIDWLPLYLVIEKRYIREKIYWVLKKRYIEYENLSIREEICWVWWGSKCWRSIESNMEILTTCEECRYCKRTHKNAWNTYCMLAFKLPAPTLFNIERLGQSEEARMKPTAGGSFSHFLWYSMSILCGSRVQGWKQACLGLHIQRVRSAVIVKKLITTRELSIVYLQSYSQPQLCSM